MKVEAIDVEIYSNSRLVVSQVKGDFEAKDLGMVEYSSPSITSIVWIGEGDPDF